MKRRRLNVVVPCTKKYITPYGSNYDVDCGLDKRILDRLNRLQSIDIVGVCEGHDNPTEEVQIYRGNFPDIAFYTYSNRTKEIRNRIKSLNNINKKHSKCSVVTEKDFTKYGDSMPQERRIKSLGCNIIGNKKGTKKWWEDVTSFLESL